MAGDVLTYTKLKQMKQMILELAEINKKLCELYDGIGFNKYNVLEKAKEYKEFIEKYQ